MKCVLLCFQVVSGLKINLNKSELVRIGGSGDAGPLAKILGCKAVKFPFKYLGFRWVLNTKTKSLGNRLSTTAIPIKVAKNRNLYNVNFFDMVMMIENIIW